MNKKFTSIFSVLIIVVFIGYMIFDTVQICRIAEEISQNSGILTAIPEKWKISDELAGQ